MESQRIEADISEIKETLREVSKALNQLTLHSHRLDTLEESCRVFRGDLKQLADSISGIHDTCLERSDVFRWGRELRETGITDPQTWWDRMVANGVMTVAAAAAGGIVASLVGRYF